MPDARTRKRWPYTASKPVRRARVMKAREGEQRGVRREVHEPRYRVTRKQARIALALAMAFMFASAAWWAYHSPWLTVDDVAVAGTERVLARDVRAAAALQGDSIFGLDLEAAEARVAALPGVADVTIEHRGRNAVVIHVEERRPWGVWQVGNTGFTIDAEGYVLDATTAPEGAPVIVDVEPARALRPGDRVEASAVELAVRLVRESDTAFGRKVLALAYRKDAGLTALLSGESVDEAPLWVTFGDMRDYDFKVAALYVLIERTRQEDISLTAVDLRFGDRLSFQ
jgi:hypothetical protein